MSLSPDPVIVLGTFRGGTSCVATAINHLGAYFGPEDEFQPASEQNPGGFWELRDMQKLNARTLLIFGMDYFRAAPLPDHWQEIPGAHEMVEEMRKLLRAKFDGYEMWGWKEPSTTILMPLYREALSREGVRSFSSVICVRHPMSVAASQSSRYKKWGYSSESLGNSTAPPVDARTIGLWAHFTLTALYDTIGTTRQVLVYENFLEKPTPFVTQMADVLLKGKPSDEQRKAAAASVDEKLSHSRHTREDLEKWPAIIGSIYDLSVRMSADIESVNRGDFDQEIETLYIDWKKTSQLTTPFELPAAKMNFVWLDEGNQGRSSHPYIQTGGWQVVRAPVGAPRNTTVQIDVCQLPCRIWIRKATWRVNGQESPAGLKPGPNGVLERLGMLRLTVIGPATMMALTPDVEGEATLELEMLVQSGEGVLRDMVTMFRKRPDGKS